MPASASPPAARDNGRADLPPRSARAPRPLPTAIADLLPSEVIAKVAEQVVEPPVPVEPVEQPEQVVEPKPVRRARADKGGTHRKARAGVGPTSLVLKEGVEVVSTEPTPVMIGKVQKGTTDRVLTCLLSDETIVYACAACLADSVSDDFYGVSPQAVLAHRRYSHSLDGRYNRPDTPLGRARLVRQGLQRAMEDIDALIEDLPKNDTTGLQIGRAEHERDVWKERALAAEERLAKVEPLLAALRGLNGVEV